MSLRLGDLLPQSLVSRVFLLHSLAMLLFIGLGFGSFVWYTARSSMQEVLDEVDTLNSVIAPGVTESAVIGDYDTIKRVLERVVTHPALVTAQFLDVHGARITVHRGNAEVLATPQWLRQRVDAALGPAQVPIVAGGRDYGVLRLSFWTHQIAAEIWQQTLMALTLALAALASGVVLVWFPLKRWLGHLGSIRDFGQRLQDRARVLDAVADTEDAPLEFRQTFVVLNQAAASLQAERAQAAVTLSAIGDGVATVNAQGQLVLVNPVLCAWLGRSCSALLGQRWADLLPELRDMHTPQRLIQLQEGARSVAVSRSPIQGPDGVTAGWVYALRDVSQEQRLAAQLQEELNSRAAAMQSMRQLLLQHCTACGDPALAPVGPLAARADIDQLSLLVRNLVQQLASQSAQLEAIFALSPDAFVAFDGQGVVHYASPALQNLCALEPQQVMGLNSQALAQRLQGLCIESQPRIDLGAAQAQRQVIELAQPRDRVLELALHRGGGGAISQVLHIRDLSHQVAVDRLKSEFITTAAHELRTPMTSIYGFSELLLMRPPTPERMKEMVTRIHRQCEAMVHILNELLDLSRMEARRGKDFQFAPQELAPLLDELTQDFRPGDGRPSPQLLLGAGCAGLCVRADRVKLLQALRNVLSNAYKYSPGGGEVRVHLALHSDASGTRAHIAVQDHGIGMSPEQLSHVTERFYRADKSGNIPGTGLGMSIVKEIIELHGGQLSLASTLGVGSTVTVALPLLAPPAQPQLPG
ncbi:ATP-binding protein [Roseateles sp. BYS180W]|uniref:histidine kinase n=1 Tax=Roseateles rivi TaxID=3299028 RepID=A0ABW7FU67_9BURK